MNPSERTRTGLTAGEIKQAFLDNLCCGMGRLEAMATKHDLYVALALTVRDRLFQRFVDSLALYGGANARRVAYLSAEFLPGPHLANNLLNLDMTESAREALRELGHDLEEILAQEEEPGLGNGGLGRLASCYMDSLASVEVPAVGLWDPLRVRDLRSGHSRRVAMRDHGQVAAIRQPVGNLAPGNRLRGQIWRPHGGGGPTNRAGIACAGFRRPRPRELPTTRQSRATVSVRATHCACGQPKPSSPFDFDAFHHGDYDRAVEHKVKSETITKVLYPNDEAHRGKVLRLKQQFFFTSCSLQDMLRLHAYFGGTPATFHEKWAVQLNDTHPAIAVAELMRLLVDEHGLGWDEAWGVTRATFAYTNHTLLPEALEKWTVDLFGRCCRGTSKLCLRSIGASLTEVTAAFPGDEARMRRLSLIDESGPRYVRMANLACVGSHTINGVARLHSELLKETVLRDFAELWPAKFCNVTNGVTPRRFVAISNPDLTQLVTKRIGDGWLRDLAKLRQLEPLADDAEFQRQWREVKLANKRRLADLIETRTGITVAPGSLFDVQVKRIHEYKRQHLAVLHILTLYLRLRKEPSADVPARTFIFGGKAAPGYFLAKRIHQAHQRCGGRGEYGSDRGRSAQGGLFP
jgi:starch phosphorylase